MDGGGGAGTAMEVLVQNLINVTKEEIFLVRGLDKEAERLKTTLMTIQGYLNDAEKNYITRDAVKAWLHELEAVAFEADDVLDEFNYHALHKKVKAMKTTMNNVFSCFSSLDHTLRPHQMARRIEEINTSFDSITKRVTDLNLQSTTVDASASASVTDFPFETDSYAVGKIIGRDADVTRLVEALARKPEEKISIVAVVGMGGMGKTTLTREVFNHQEMRTRFGCHSWVYVSQTFNPRLLFKKFLASLSSLRSTSDEIESKQGILTKLEEALKNKTYLLVLDDFWNDDIPEWEGFINSLLGVTSTNGNGIIITTRNTHVDSIVNPLDKHILGVLPDEDCWSIIKAKAFGEESEIPSEFETIGRKIARRCKGLPLAAQVVGGVLRRKSEQEWHSIELKWIEGDGITRILRLSYDNLSSAALKKCFAYCSIFPKGHKMGKQELIELWMAEGFLQPDERNDMECVGDKFVKVLLHSSLLQPAPRKRDYDDDDEMCVMHDLVHDLASSVLGSLKVRYMCRGDESFHIPKKSAKHLRTLFLLEGDISEFQLTHFKSLHVLSFGGRPYSKLQLSSIMKLIHLRRLDISKTRIKYLPDSIGELHHLQTLIANTWRLKELPRTMKYLISLRHLYIEDGVKFPPEIGSLTSLQTLTHFTVGHEDGCQIEEIGSLKNLKGKLKICNLEKVKDKEEAKKANLPQNSNLLELSFIWSDDGRDKIHINEEKVLEGLQPHSNLKKLEIISFKGKEFPLWIMKMAVPDESQGSWLMLKNLVEITLNECDECEEIPMLGLLPNLKHLYLRWLSNVKSLNSSFYGIGVGEETFSVFPVLARLELDYMLELREWADVESPDEVKVFPSLLYLSISHCKQLRSIPRHSFGSLKELQIHALAELECLPDGLFRINQNLSELRISFCPKLREFPDGLGTLSSLKELDICGCPNLKSIGNPIGQSQATLRQLWIRACEGLMELPHEVVESWAPSLEEVWLTSLSSLKNLPKLIECLAKSTRLRSLHIFGVPKFMATRTVESWPFHSLQYLRIDASVEWSRENSVGIKETVDGILQGCNPHSLVLLDLTGLEIWECLPESIQNLTGLSSLDLSNFGIEELPEWFGNFSSLERLFLSRCKKLRCLFGDDTLGRLTKLTEILVTNCPELRIDSKWCRNNNLSIFVDHNKMSMDNKCLKLAPCL